MNRSLRWSAAVLLVTAWAAACERAPTRPSPQSNFDAAQDLASGRYIVVLRDGADPEALAAANGVSPVFTYRHAITGFSAVLPDAARQALERSPLVRWVEPVQVYHVAGVMQTPQTHKPGHPCRGKNCPPPPPPPPPTPTCNQGSGLPGNDDLSELWGIRKVDAPASPTWNNNPVNVDIAMLDTGADQDHPDLCIHQAVSFDPFEPTPEDVNGHGTHTSGTAGARDDNGIVVGVAPTARLWVVKVCNGFGICFGDAIVAGIDYVTAHADEIDVASMSLGGGGGDQPHPTDPIDCTPITGDAMHLSICNSVQAGVTYSVAAGNGASDASGTVPAAYDEVITVAALDESETAAGFSNFGADVDLIAPGVAVKSDWLNGGTNTISGTSMATPHVSGGAALFIASEMNAGRPRPAPLAVRNRLVADGKAWLGQGGLHPEPLLDVHRY